MHWNSTIMREKVFYYFLNAPSFLTKNVLIEKLNHHFLL